MKKYLNQRGDQSVSTNSLCNLARIILAENYFELGEDIYHQKLGIAIVTKFAPPYVNLVTSGL